MGRARLRHWLPVLAVGLLSLLPLWAASHNLTDRNDDAYITLTYAKSLAAGNGWRFNGGEEALGTTTPLFALLLAAMARALPSVSLERLAVALSTLSWLGSAWLLLLGHAGFGLRRHGGALAAASVLCLGGWWLAALGMEGATFVFGLLLAVWLAGRRHAFLSGACAGLLFLLRPEGLAMVPLAGAWLLARGGRPWPDTLLRFAGGALLPLLPWAAYALPHFGSLLSNSASAKLEQGKGWPGRPFVERLGTEWLPGYAAWFGLSPALSLLWPLSVAGLFHAARRARPLLLLAGWLGLFLAGYGWLGAPGYWWYGLPVLFALHLFAALGLLGLLAHRGRAQRGAGVALAGLFFFFALRLSLASIQGSTGDARAPTYRAVAAWLSAHAAPGHTVAFAEIGYLGYFSEQPVVDLAGLTSPRLRDNASNLDFESNFWLSEPDYLLYHPAFDWILGQIVTDARFAARYRPVAEFPSHLGSPMRLYQRTEDASPDPT